MKPFNLEQAKAGKPVVTRTGRPVRILCWDAKGSDPIVGLIELDFTSYASTYNESGIFRENVESEQDLFMKSETKVGWVAVFNDGKSISTIYDTKEKAETIGGTYPNFAAVAKIEWEE